MMRNVTLAIVISILLAAETYGGWKQLAPGMAHGVFPVNLPERGRELQIVILRIDPKLWDFVLVGTSWKEGYENQTAKAWCEDLDLTAAINAGMFATDYATHVGYLGARGHVNSRHVNKYMSVAAFDPKKGKQLPAFRIFDLDDPRVTMDNIRHDYASVVQNLRLIKRPGENRWPQQSKKWSETALGEDRTGRALFIFVRSPESMHDLNHALLSLGVGIVAAQHLEGGPEAQLYYQVGNVAREMFGSYETTYRKDEKNAASWPIPNIIGVRPKT